MSIMKRLSLLVVLAVAVIILLTGCPFIPKNISLAGTWNLYISVGGEVVTDAAIMEITSHANGQLAGFVKANPGSGSIGSVAGTTSSDNITFIFTHISGERTVHFTGKFSRNAMHGTAIAYDNGTYVSGPHNWTAQRQ